MPTQKGQLSKVIRQIAKLEARLRALRKRENEILLAAYQVRSVHYLKGLKSTNGPGANVAAIARDLDVPVQHLYRVVNAMYRARRKGLQ